MSRFATALTGLMKGQNLTQAELSKRSGVAQPSISRWLNGEISISDSDFERVCEVFDRALDQANLQRARLLDVISSSDVPGNKLIEVQISGELLQEDSPGYRAKLPPKLEKDFEMLIKHAATNRLVKDLISSVAAHLRRDSD